MWLDLGLGQPPRLSALSGLELRPSPALFEEDRLPNKSQLSQVSFLPSVGASATVK